MSEVYLENSVSVGRSKASSWEMLRAFTWHIAEKRRERRAIRELQEMDDHMLCDMGLSRSDIRAAVRGEFHRP